MAISNLQLNVRANTARALADFNKFSRSLDNKFLMSGLKLDVITSALDRINRDFQRAIGEQGLASASSLRAAQNQAALLTQTFKGFASDSAIAIQEQIGTALNRVAVTAGGTMKDVQKTLAATPFISTRLSEDMRDQLNKGIFAFQRDARRAGLGENLGAIAQQFLMGRASGMDLVQTGNPLESFIGAEIIKRSGGQGEIPDALMRSQVFFEVITDKRIQDMLQDMAKKAMGFRLILEDINTKLFNPEFGVFGSLKKVVDSAGKTTTMFDEVENLTKQVFGEDGMFAALSKTLKEVLGPGFDPMRPFIDAVQGITKVFKALTDYFNSSGFKNVAKFAKDIFDQVYGVFRDIFNAIKGMSSSGFDEDSIIAGIRDIGKTIKEYIQNIGKKIRDTDTKDETGAIASIAGTVLEEMGKSAVVLFKELLMTIIDKVPEIAMQVLPALNNGINAILTEMFGELGGKVAKFVLGFIPGIGPLARASAAGDITGGGGNPLSMLAMGASALLGPAALFGGAKFLRGATTQRGRFGMLNRLGERFYGMESSFNKSFFLDDPITGANRFSPLSRRIIDPLSARMRPGSAYEREYIDLFRGGVFTPPPAGFGGPRAVRSGRISTTLEGPDLRGFTGTLSRDDLNRYLSAYYQWGSSPGSGGSSGGGGSRRPPGGGGGGGALAIGGPGIGFLSALSSLTRPRGFMRRLTGDDFDPFDTDSGIRGRTMYSGMGAGPQPDTVNNPAPGMSPLDPRFPWAGPGQPYMESRLLTPQEMSQRDSFEFDAEWRKEYRSRRDVRRRFIQSQGGGLKGRRALLGAQMKRMGRGVRGFGKGALITGAIAGAGALGLGIFGGPGANAQTTQFDPATGQMVPVQGGGGMDLSGAGSVLSGGFEGATIGATIGSVVPGIGTAAGAVIGGIIGGIAPLMDKGVRDSIGKLVSDLGTRFGEIAEWFSEGTKSNFEKLGNMLGTLIKGLGNALVFSINASLTAFTLLPRLIIGTVESLFNMLPDNLKPAWAKSVIGGISSVANFQLPYFFGGKDYYGPSMALEAQMSGRRPMVVNDGEFVIPKDGFPTLAGLVANNLRSTNALREPPNNTQVNITLAITTNSVVADASELANTLREPVYQIINDAWAEATASNVQRSRMN